MNIKPKVCRPISFFLSLCIVLTLFITPSQSVLAVNKFNDVTTEDWFYESVGWAIDHNITDGVGDGLFGPDIPATREQAVTFLWAEAGKPQPSPTSLSFSDVKVSDWFYTPVLWAVENGITNGISETEFGVGKICTRAEIITFLWAAAGRPNATSSEFSFDDVNTSDWYYIPVLWAVENDITNGTGNGKFSPNGSCTRAQIVTFMFAYNKATAMPDATPDLTPKPTPVPTPEPTPVPTPEPTPVPTPVPTPEPTPVPTPEPTPIPTPTPEIVDLTDKLNTLMRTNAIYLKNYEAKYGHTRASIHFYNLVKDGGKWDIKLTDEWKFEKDKIYVYRGKVMRMDDPGNIHFGYTGAVLFPESFVCFGAGMNNISKFEFTTGNLDSYYDDPQDQEMMKWGYSLYFEDQKNGY